MPICGARLLFVLMATSHGVSAESFSKIENDFTNWIYNTWPRYAHTFGHPGYGDKIDSITLASYDQIRDNSSLFMQRLLKIDKTKLNRTRQLDSRLLTTVLRTFLDNYKWRMYSALNPVNLREGPQLLYMNVGVQLKTEQNFQVYLTRQKGIARQIDECIVMMKEAVRVGRTNHNISMIPSLTQIQARIHQNGTYHIAKQKLDESTLSANIKRSLQSDMVQVVNNTLVPAYQRLHDYIQNEYLTRKAYGVSDWPGGNGFYKACLKYHTGTNLTPQQIMDTGLSEVMRITNLIRKAMKRLGYTGSSISQFYEDRVKNNPSMKFNTSKQILAAYGKIIQKIDTNIHQLFHNDLFTTPVRVVSAPADSGIAYYNMKIVNGQRVGFMTVNTFRPENQLRPVMVALTLHEAVPGHHLQLTANMNSNMPIYRREQMGDAMFKSPFGYDSYTAFIEGWGLYAEYLGEELGVYKDDYELIGRYNWEITRAIRLVVDTGIHALGWTRTQAIDYTIASSITERRDIEVSTDRYITWPGQACAYKIGEMKIKKLRKKAEKELGSLFNVKDFHSVCLKSGAIPLAILEEHVDHYIKDVKMKSITTPKSGGITFSAGVNAFLAAPLIAIYIIRFRDN